MNNCSAINHREARKIQGLFFNYIKNNQDIPKFINLDLAKYFSDNYGRKLSVEELEFISRVLDSAIIPHKNSARKIVTSEQKSTIFGEADVRTVYNTLVGASQEIEKNLFNINSIIEENLKTSIQTSNISVPQQAPEEGDISNTLDNTLYEESKIDSFSGIKNSSDIDQKLYKGAFGAKLVMERLFSNGIIRKVLIDSKNALYNNNTEYIDKAIKEYKLGLYSELINYFKKTHPGIIDEFSDQYYVEGRINKEYSKVQDKISSFYKDNMQLSNATLNNWASYSTKDMREKLFAYSKFIILNNFDSLLSLYSGKIFKIDQAYLSNLTEDYNKSKYYLVVSNNLMSNFITNKEQFDVMSEQTALYKLLVKSLPFISKDGEIDLGKNIQVSAVNYTVAKLLKDIRSANLTSINEGKSREEKLTEFDRTNPVRSFKSILEYIVHNSILGNKYDLPSNYDESEISILRTLYFGVFKTDSNLQDVVGKDFYNKMENSGSLSILGPSLYEVSLNTASKTTTTDLDYFDVLVHNFSKVFLNNYVENIYDPDIKTIISGRPDAKVSQTQKILLRNNLRHYSNQKIDKSIIRDEFSDVLIDIDKGQVVINTDLLPVIVDIKKGHVLYDGKRLTKDNKLILGLDTTSDRFLKNIEYHTGINVSSDLNLMSVLSSEIDMPKANHQTIERLSRIAGYSIFSKYLINSDMFDKSKPIESLKKIPYLSEKLSKGMKIWDSGTETISLSGINEQIPHDISAISKGLSLIRGDFAKAVIKTASGVTMPLHGNIRHIYNIKDFLKSLIRDNKGLKGMPIENNLFANNQEMIKEPVIRTYSQVFEKTKHSSELYPEEINYSQLLYEFYGSLIQEREAKVPYREVLIQTSVFADKNTAYSVPVNMSSAINLKYYSSGKIATVNKSLMDVSIEEIKGAHFFSEHGYYKNMENRISEIYTPVLKKLIINAGYTDIGDFINKNSISTIRKIETINTIMGFFDESSFRKMFYEVHGNRIPLIQDLGISIVNKKLSLSESLVHFSKSFVTGKNVKVTDLYEKRMTDKLNDYVSNLEKIGLNIEYKNEFNSENKILKQSADLLGINIKSWIDPNTGYLILRNKKGEINPLIERYFWTFNLITDNYQTLVTGKIHNHPTKGKISENIKIGSEEYYNRVETLKTGMYLKRQLQGTPMDTFAQGLINGIREKTKTVFLTDVNLPTFNVYGTNDKMTVTDGGTLMTMVQAILQNNSLLDKSVGMNQKTLGLSIDPIYNSYGLMKHCAFAMTNEDIKNSKGSRYDYDNLYKIGYKIHLNESRIFGEKSIVYTPDLLKDYSGNKITISGYEKKVDKTKVWVTGLSDNGLYYKDENNNIIKVIDIDYAAKDSNTGRPLSNEYVVRKFDITNNQELPLETFIPNDLYEIWKILGGENSVSLDPEGKYIVGDLRFTSSDSSHYALTNLINKVGEYKDNFLKERLKLKYNLTDVDVSNLFPDLEFRDIDRTSEKPDQHVIWQPLKDKFIGQFQFASSQKSGAGSIQNIDEVMSSINPTGFQGFQGFRGYKGGFEDRGKGTPEGDGKDKAMRQVADGFIGEIKTKNSSSYTSYYQINKKVNSGLGLGSTWNDNKNTLLNPLKPPSIVMLARNSEFSGKELSEETKKSIIEALNNNAEFIVGDMPNVDSQFIDYLQEIGAKFTIYHTGNNSRITVQEKRYSLPVHTEVSTLSTGILMDPDHVIDSTDPSKMSDITEMTQIVQALEFNGDTHEIAKEAYESLAQLTRVKLGEFLEATEVFKATKNVEDKKNLYDKVTKQLIKSYKTKTQSVSNQKMLEWVENSLNKQKQLEGQIGNEEDSKLPANIENLDTLMPFSAQSVYNGFISMLSNMFNKLAIKRKHAGIASVLKPSGAFVQVYDIPIFNENNEVTGYKVVTSDRMNSEYPNLREYRVPFKRGDISLNDWVEINGVQTYIDTPKLLTQIKSQGTLEDDISILYGKPRDLRPADFRFVLEGKSRNTSVFELDEFIDCMDYDNKNFTERIVSLAARNNIDINNSEDMTQLLKNQIQRVMKQISRDKFIDIKGIRYNVISVESIPGEALGPNIYRNKFGLPKGVSIDEISEEYFLNMLNANALPKVKESDFYVRTANGRHVYVFINKPNDLVFQSRFSDTDRRIEKIEGENWILNEFGEKVYNIDDLNFKKYFDGGLLHDAIIINSDADLSRIRALIKKSISDYSNLIDLLPSDMVSVNQLSAGNANLAKELFSSFQVSNEYTSARIPGQGAQSFTPLRLIDYIHTQSNTIMTNHFTSWLKGEDYDVDKGFWLGVTLDEKGKVVGWSKEFDYTSGDSLRLSLKLPMPDGKVRIYHPSSEIVITQEEYNSLLNPLSISKVNTLQKIRSAETFSIDPLIASEETIDKLTNIINTYFGEQINIYQMEAAVKNKIARAMYETILAPETQVHAGSPIGMDAPRDAAAEVEKKFKYTMSLNDPSLIAELQYQNMEGKGTIGIGAVALKVFSGLSYWANEKVREGKFKDITFFKTFKSEEGTKNYFSPANVNFESEEEKENFIQYIGSYFDEGKGKESLMKDLRSRMDLNHDKSLTLSALLSAATDNAKELILSKINAGTATAGVYAHLTMMGVPFLDISKMMTSEPVQWIVNYAKENIFNKNKEFRNIDLGIKAYTQGPNHANYISQTSFKSINKYFKNLLISNSSKLRLNRVQMEKLRANRIDILSAETLRSIFPDKIQSVLEVMKNNLPESLTRHKKISSDDELLEDTAMDESTGETVRVRVPIGRFIKELDNYFTEVGYKLSKKDLEIVDQFKKAYDDAKEITILGSKFGINQGMKTDSYTQYKFFADMDVFWQEQVSKVIELDPLIKELSSIYEISSEEAEGFLDAVKKDFSFKKFISGSEEYRDLVTKVYDYYKSTYNLFDILRTVPHFAEMLKVPILADDIQGALSIKYRTVDKMVKELFNKAIIAKKLSISGTTFYNPLLSDKNYLRLSDFCNDVLISKWLKNLDFSINYYSKERWNDKLIKEVLPDSVENYPVDVATVHGRANFLDMFESMLLGLQKGYTKSEGNTTMIPALKNNLFIKDLVTDFRKDPLSGIQEKYFRLPINILSNSEFDSTQFNNYVIGFQNLGSIMYEGKSIKDIFFIYNAIVNRDKVNKDSFTKLFEYDTKFTRDSLMYNYINFLGNIDNSNEILKEVEESNIPDYNIDDLILKGFANKILEGQLNSGKFFGKYVYITYSDGEKSTSEYYQWTGNGYQRYSHFGKVSTIPLSTDSITSIEKLESIKFENVEDLISKLISLDNNFKAKIECHGM